MVDIMTRWGSCDFYKLKIMAENIDRLVETTELLEDVTKELTARLLAKVIPRTPVGQYPAGSGKTGGTLKRGWTSASHDDAVKGKRVGAKKFVENLELNRVGNYIEVQIINPVEYASFVEMGHLTRNGKKWVAGQHMLRMSVEELKSEAPRIIEKKVKEEMKKVFKR